MMLREKKNKDIIQGVEPVWLTELRRKKALENISLVCLQLMKWLKVCHSLQENRFYVA